MAELLYRLGLTAARRARTVLVLWVAVLAAVGVAYAVAGGTLANSFTIPGTPTAEVTDRLQVDLPEAAGGTGTVVLRTEDGAPFTDEQRAATADLVAQAAEVEGVEAVVDPFATEGERDLALCGAQPRGASGSSGEQFSAGRGERGSRTSGVNAAVASHA